jgi:chaperonin GroEL
VRLAALSGGVAVIRVGGASEAEAKERRDRVDDARHAVRAALAEGVVPGGGAALLHAGAALDRLEPANYEQRLGVTAVRRALSAPLRQLAENAGRAGTAAAAGLLELGDPRLGWEAVSGAYADMVEAGIIDPARVVRAALENAGSVASLLVTIEAAVAECSTPARETVGAGT